MFSLSGNNIGVENHASVKSRFAMSQHLQFAGTARRRTFRDYIPEIIRGNASLHLRYNVVHRYV